MTLYPYQRRVRDLLLQGNSVIVQAPTGTGKTRAALAPFIEAFFDYAPTDFPRKCIYSVPIRVLANQFYAEYDDLAKSYYRRLRQPIKVGIQTGEQPHDARLLKDLIFATIDQSLSSALAVPYSLSSGRANMNAGAVFSSYLVFDEFHLFPTAENGTEGALGTTLQLLTRLKDCVPFVLMTATFSSTMLDRLAAMLKATVVTVPADEYLKIASGGATRPRQRAYLTVDEPLTADAVLSAHQTRSIVICNQVRRAQQLFQDLRDKTADGDIEVLLLHSRFTPNDRQTKEQMIRHEFGKDTAQRQSGSLILVATQVVEVGLDITCENLHTEIAPANAVLQRAGRCARYPGERGQVHIYRVPNRRTRGNRTPAEEVPDYLPYPVGLCESTWRSFAFRSGSTLGFEQEQEIIDEVHAESDQAMLDALDRQAEMLWKDIFLAMETHDQSTRAHLIRKIDSITVLAGREPSSVGNPFAAEGFSFRRGSVAGILRELWDFGTAYDPGEGANPWFMAYPTVDDRNAEDSTASLEISWHEVLNPELLSTANIVVINSAFCAYDMDVGFRITAPQEGSTWQSQPGDLSTNAHGERYSYRLEDYQAHISEMLRIYDEAFRADYAYIEQRLANQSKIPLHGIDLGIHLALMFHDVAKMDKRWQKWVRLYQAAIGEPITDERFMAVHTHSSPTVSQHRTARDKTDRQIKRPHHAGESAVAIAPWVAELSRNEPLARAVITAVARHHSPNTGTFSDFDLHPAAGEVMQQVVKLAEFTEPSRELTRSHARGGDLEKLLIQPQNFEQILLYLLIVRILRLCDGLSQERNIMEGS